MFQALIASTQYNLKQIVNTSLIRTICTNFDAFRIKADPQFDALYSPATARA